MIDMGEKIDWDEYVAKLVSRRGSTATDFELLKRYVHGRILDAGCGTGILLGQLAASGVQEAVGVDVGMPGLVYGKRKFPNANFVAASVYQLPFKSSYFDLVYSIDVIEHLETPLLALKEYYRVCKPGGIVFIQTPNYPIKRVYDVLHVIRGSRDEWRDDPTHVSRFNYKSLFVSVSQAGFKVELAVARNIFFQKYIPLIKHLRKSTIGYILGQKIIIVARKPINL